MSSNYYFNGERYIYEDDDGNIHDIDAWSDNKMPEHVKDYIERVSEPDISHEEIWSEDEVEVNPEEEEHHSTFVKPTFGPGGFVPGGTRKGTPIEGSGEWIPYQTYQDILPQDPTYIDEAKKTRYKRITVEYYESLEDGSRVECNSEEAKDIKMEF